MILQIPQLALKRLVVQCRGVSVYDETFHHGVNIIRGSNSSGKSTIADFIFYILGGEVAKFKPEAERCEEILAEVEISGKPLTLRRIVKLGGKQPILISYNDFPNALASPVEGWQVFSMVRSANKESFSQIIFRALGLPEVKTDTENSITMHQLLRLMYVDQMSPVDALLRFEAFDPPLIRQTVGDLFLGLYDDLLYNELREHREKTKSLESMTDRLEGLQRAVEETEIEVDEKQLDAKVAKISVELKAIESALNESSAAALDKVVTPDAKKQIDALAAEFRRVKMELSGLLSRADSSELEIADSESFIEELKKRIAAIDDSITTRNSLGELPLTHCPHCLAMLQAKGNDNLCALCGNEVPENPSDSKALRMKQELSQQLKESQRLLEGKGQILASLEAKVTELKTRVKNTERQYENAVERVRPAREDKIDQLLIRKGELTAELENINKQIKLSALLKSYAAQKAVLSSAIQSLYMSIERRKRTQMERRFAATEAIEKRALFLLKNDLPREEMFQQGKNVTVDFPKNTFALDGRNQFSASSVVYLKNSVHYAILFSSLDLVFVRYPRFIVCDNMEDKGMEQERSRNFQKLVVQLSEASQIQHQIIFTTSMIDPSLNNDKYCIGPEYSDKKKSLDFSRLKSVI